MFDMGINHETELDFKDDEFLFFNEGIPDYQLIRPKFQKLTTLYTLRIIIYSFIKLNPHLEKERIIKYINLIVEKHFISQFEENQIEKIVSDVLGLNLDLEANLHRRYVFFDPRVSFQPTEKQAITAHLIHSSNISIYDLEYVIENLMGEKKKISNVEISAYFYVSSRSITNLLSKNQKERIKKFNNDVSLDLLIEQYYTAINDLDSLEISISRKNIMTITKFSGTQMSLIIREVKNRKMN
jgi:hypothetical protein